MSVSSELSLHDVLTFPPKRDRDIANISSDSSPPDKILQKRRDQCKRAKKNNKKCTRVTFATADDVTSSSFSEAGPKDDGENQTESHSIWYTSKEYASFLQDRADTIRVYRSVHGNMAGLEDYYCTTGLEHFLPENGQVVLRQSQLRVISAVLSEQHRQKLHRKPDAEYVSRLVASLSADAKQQAQKRASSYLLSPFKLVSDESAYGNDMRSCIGRIGKDILTNPMRLVSLPLPSPNRSSSSMFHPVDTTTLRQMNLRLLESFHTKTESLSSYTITDENSAALRSTAKGVSRSPALPKSSLPENVNSAVLAAMNEALAITDVFSDPECR